jgi:hypothetical protein
MMWWAGGRVRGVVVVVCGRTSAGRVVGIVSGVFVFVGGAKMSARETLRRCEGVGLR